MGDVSERVAALATMSPVQLRAAWLQQFKQPAPQVTPDLLRRGLAHRMQEKVHGRLGTAHARELEKLTFTGGGEPTRQPPRLTPGTRLVRDWGGTSHHVSVLADGEFLYADQHYRSLSVIARTITGARWSGPRFFGLTGRSAVDA